MKFTMKTAAAALLAASMLAAAPAPAAAQAWIGQMAGEMAARGAEVAREKACREGAPASPGAVTDITAKSNALMGAYFELAAASKPAAVGKVFAVKLPGLVWKTADGPVPVTELGARLDEPTPVLTPVSFVVGGDAASARGVWSAQPPGEGVAPVFYAVDFVGTPNFWIGSSWRIWHMTVLPADAPPAAPAAYCHYDPDQAW